MKVIGYIRVSTDEQAQGGVSLEAQRAKLEQYAELYEIDLVEVVVDAGVSAKNLHRDGLKAALTAWRFHAMPITQNTGSRSPIPRKPITDSTGSRSLVPRHADQSRIV